MSDKKLSESVIMPREDFAELSQVAFDNHHVPSIGERTAQTVQNTVFLASLAGTVAAGSWGWAKAMDWLENRRHDRKIVEIETVPGIRRTSK